MKKVLEVRHLTKRYGQHLALDNVNLTLEKGEVYGLIGRNGAGKTTLIKVITKLIRPSQGSVSLFHSTSKSEWTHALKRVGSVIETPSPLIISTHVKIYVTTARFITFQILTKSLKKSLIRLDLVTLARKNFVVSHWV